MVTNIPKSRTRGTLSLNRLQSVLIVKQKPTTVPPISRGPDIATPKHALQERAGKDSTETNLARRTLDTIVN
jgi:hypothetical protein